MVVYGLQVGMVGLNDIEKTFVLANQVMITKDDEVYTPITRIMYKQR